MHKVLVAGAHGNTGKKVIKLLTASQYFTPVAMVRKKEYLEDFESQNVKAVLADLTEDVAQVFEHDIEKVIFAAGSGGEAVVEVDQEGAINLIREAKKAGVKKFVMLSSMGVDNPGQMPELEDYLKAKQQADAFLKQSGLRYAIVRPGTLNDEPGKGLIKLAPKLSESGEISRDDVAQTLVRMVHDDSPNDTTFEIVAGDKPIGKAIDDLE